MDQFRPAAARPIPGVTARGTMRLDEIRRVAVLGAGTMGPGIAQVYAQAGYEVSVFSPNPAEFEMARGVIAMNLDLLAEYGTIAASARATVLERLSFTDSLAEAAADADVVVEAVVEDSGVKRQVFSDLEPLCRWESVWLSNTSALDIFKLVGRARRPNTAIAHWMAPPHIMPVVEVVRGPETSEETMRLSVSLHKRLGKMPIVMEKFVPGFIINRLQRALGREVFFLLDNGYISAEDLDAAARAGLALRMNVLGVVQRYDFTGLDVSAANLKNVEFFDAPLNNEPVSLFSRVRCGDLGVKTGKGFYDYGGRDLKEILRERDVRLLKIVKALGSCYQREPLV